jgi:hypothetical protein
MSATAIGFRTLLIWPSKYQAPRRGRREWRTLASYSQPDGGGEIQCAAGQEQDACRDRCVNAGHRMAANATLESDQQ